jgi:hypothetical protein
MQENESKHDSADKRAYDVGFKAFESEGPEARNPHRPDSEEAKYWDHGFRDAQKVSAPRT